MKHGKRIALVGFCCVLVALVVLFVAAYFHSTVISCPNCGETRRALFLSSDQKLLLEWRAELKMEPRVKVFYANGGMERTWAVPPKDMSEEDREVKNYYTSTLGRPLARLQLIARKANELETKLGEGGIICPHCKKAQLEIAEKGLHSIWP